MSPDTLPLWLAIPAFILVTGTALYLHWIRPGYLKDRSENSEQN